MSDTPINLSTQPHVVSLNGKQLKHITHEVVDLLEKLSVSTGLDLVTLTTGMMFTCGFTLGEVGVNIDTDASIAKELFAFNHGYLAGQDMYFKKTNNI